MIALKSNKKLTFNAETGLEGYIIRKLGFRQITDEGYSVQVIQQCISEDNNILDENSYITPYSNEEIDALCQHLQVDISDVSKLRTNLDEVFFQALYIETVRLLSTGKYRFNSNPQDWVKVAE